LNDALTSAKSLASELARGLVKGSQRPWPWMFPIKSITTEFHTKLFYGWKLVVLGHKNLKVAPDIFDLPSKFCFDSGVLLVLLSHNRGLEGKIGSGSRKGSEWENCENKGTVWL
jgi:hypothetical protein